VSQLE
jgi:hypothetical protein